MKEANSALMGVLKERLANPFVSTYFLIFFYFNWQPIALLLFDSKESLKSRVQIFSDADLFYWWPLAWAFFFIVAVNILNIFPEVVKHASVSVKNRILAFEWLQIRMFTAEEFNEMKIIATQSAEEADRLRVKNKQLTTQLEEILSTPDPVSSEGEPSTGEVSGHGAASISSEIEFESEAEKESWRVLSVPSPLKINITKAKSFGTVSSSRGSPGFQFSLDFMSEGLSFNEEAYELIVPIVGVAAIDVVVIDLRSLIESRLLDVRSSNLPNVIVDNLYMLIVCLEKLLLDRDNIKNDRNDLGDYVLLDRNAIKLYQ